MGTPTPASGSACQLPVAVAAAGTTLGLMKPSGTSLSFDLKGRKILIVDDDRINTGVLGGILQGEDRKSVV